MSDTVALIFAGLPAVVGLVCLANSIHLLRRYVKLDRVPPTDVVAVDGDEETVELVGRAYPADEPLTSPFQGEDTLAYWWAIKQFKLNSSRNHWRESGRETTPFVLKDSTGEILVDPEGADIAIDLTAEREVVLETDDETLPTAPAREKLDELDMEVAAESSDTYRSRKFYAKRLDVGEQVHVYGPVRPGPAENAPDNVVQPYIGTDGRTADGTFIVSDTSEQETKRRLLGRGLRWGAWGVGLFALALVIFFAFPERTINLFARYGQFDHDHSVLPT